MDALIGTTCILLRLHAAHARAAFEVRRTQDGDAGVSTLEMVIIALGLMAIAGLLVAALVSAVTSRTNQIK